MAEENKRRAAAPQAFLNYAHYDDKFLRGAIQHLREDLEDAIRFVTGRDFHIFLDTDGIEFGQHWPTLLSDRLKSANFLIPMLSPNYFQSETCKQEAFQFMQYEAELKRNDLVLPIYLADTPFVEDPKAREDNEFAIRLSERQYRDYRDLVFEDRTSPKRSHFIKELALEIGKVSARVSVEKTSKKNNEEYIEDKFDRDNLSITEALLDANGLITFSRRRIAIGPNAVETMRRFWNLLEMLFENNRSVLPKDRLFIWIIDVGSRLIEQPFSFDEYFNADLLALQFQSFLQFDSIKDYDEINRARLFRRRRTSHPAHRNKRWQWLSERAVVVVQNLRPEEHEGLYSGIGAPPIRSRFRFLAEHVLPSATPADWVPQMQKLYRKNIDAADATFTVFINQPNEKKNNQDPPFQLRYFAHAEIIDESQSSLSNSNDAGAYTQSVELSSPGKNYDDAFQLLHAAACYRLGITEALASEEGPAALAYIEKLGFQVLTVTDFVRCFSRVFEFDDNSGN